ncbi:MAG: hypothetical protein AVDCRST_MAG79-1867, partial [uncultured Thermoleophilia bacterium]
AGAAQEGGAGTADGPSAGAAARRAAAVDGAASRPSRADAKLPVPDRGGAGTADGRSVCSSATRASAADTPKDDPGLMEEVSDLPAAALSRPSRQGTMTAVGTMCRRGVLPSAVLAVLAGLGPAHAAARPETGPRDPAAHRQVMLLGRSWQGRPIRVVRLGRADATRNILVVGCIHGTERAGLSVTARLQGATPPPGVALWVLGTLNPDGAAARTRGNARGVDLNRNFSWRWRPIGRPGDAFHAGARPFSERESRIARSLLRRVRPDVTVWYHQALGLVDPSTPAATVERRYARAVGLPLREIGPLPGVATGWSNHVLPGTTSFVVELGSGSLTPARARRHAAAVLEVAASVRSTAAAEHTARPREP